MLVNKKGSSQLEDKIYTSVQQSKIAALAKEKVIEAGGCKTWLKQNAPTFHIGDTLWWEDGVVQILQKDGYQVKETQDQLTIMSPERFKKEQIKEKMKQEFIS